MAYTTTDTHRTGSETVLQDFVIQGGAELGNCRGAQSFRATRRLDGGPVLLHKFRPAESLMALGPRVTGREPPDFTKPFVTRFTDLLVVAGSAYLVEPLPPCAGLGEVWRYALQKRPYQALQVMTVLIRQMLSIHRHPPRGRKDCGLFDLQSIVLASTGAFGVLAAHLECEQGLLRLRKGTPRPVQSDFHSLVEVLGTLLDIDAEVAALQGAPLRLSADIHRKISRLLCAVRLSERRPRASVRS